MDDTLAQLATVAFELGLAGPTQADATDALPGEVGPHAGEARQAVLELSQLDLQPPFVCGGAASEDIENERRAVDHLDIERAFQVALLRRGEVVVDHDDVVPGFFPAHSDLFQFPFTDVGAGQRMSELLRSRTDDLDIDGLGQASQLFQRIGSRPGLSRALDSDEESMLRRPVGGKWDASNESLLMRLSSMGEPAAGMPTASVAQEPRVGTPA
jgi:hypothetical protein